MLDQVSSTVVDEHHGLSWTDERRHRIQSQVAVHFAQREPLRGVPEAVRRAGVGGVGVLTPCSFTDDGAFNPTVTTWRPLPWSGLAGGYYSGDEPPRGAPRAVAGEADARGPASATEE